jgi:hypothetical protein
VDPDPGNHRFGSEVVWPKPSRRKRTDRPGRTRQPHRRLLGLALLAVTVAAAIGAATFTFTRPTDEAAASAAVRELLIVAQEGSTDYGGGSSSPSPAPSPTKRRPVVGLNQAAMDNAVAIVEAGKQMNLPKRAYLVAIMTALQETGLRNLANATVPQSLKYPHQGVYQNYDSVGLFQQRPSQDWGTVAQLMDPPHGCPAVLQPTGQGPGLAGDERRQRRPSSATLRVSRRLRHAPSPRSADCGCDCLTPAGDEEPAALDPVRGAAASGRPCMRVLPMVVPRRWPPR